MRTKELAHLCEKIPIIQKNKNNLINEILRI